jgi:lipoic acid synthetase
VSKLKIEPKKRLKKPAWLRKRLPIGAEYEQVRSLVSSGRLHTVCQAAKCPNIWECFSHHTATFLILGDRCSRNCRFCAVAHGPVEAPDPDEPARVAEAAREMGLKYVVVTSVTRDDLPDGGAGHFAAVIRTVHARLPAALIEVLIPDFQGRWDDLKIVLDAAPDVLNHNIETVPRLYPSVRPEALYNRSLELLQNARQFDATLPIKSGLMLGLGETPPEIRQTLKDLRDAGCVILTLGQYLQPSAGHLPVHEYVTPEAFAEWKEIALAMGFDEVASGPFVRSSYHARELFEATRLRTK